MAFGGYGTRLEDHEANPRMTSFAFQQLETAREVQTLFTDGIRDDPNWKTREGKKPELIMWVKRAMGGARSSPSSLPRSITPPMATRAASANSNTSSPASAITTRSGSSIRSVWVGPKVWRSRAATNPRSSVPWHS